ncbi:hypothetical protein O7602_14255 [Micromonospora sp. WMMD1128]|uniref:hypothetical protein n=1 Tax=Micromonospora sp. WMMD1128 TaxID=3015150 RepID=UPI00248CA9E9|nr:hypothetical protein [Micromonospora sp. WMMD1128]WBB76618.1 hypothetical protein O7602_14255 [Micromonospora sp. WMMD1128]
MGRWWKWFQRSGQIAVDAAEPVIPDGDVPGRRQQQSAAVRVPDVLVTSRCDGAEVYQRAGRRAACVVRNQRADRYGRGRGADG